MTKKVVKYRHGTQHGLAYDLPTQHQPNLRKMYYHRLHRLPNNPITKQEYDNIETLLRCANRDEAVYAIYNELNKRGLTGFKSTTFLKKVTYIMPNDSKFNENEDFIGFIENLRVDESGQHAMYETNDIEHPWKPYDFEPKMNETVLTPLQKINYMRCIRGLPLHPDTPAPPRALSSSGSESMSDEGGRRRRSTQRR